MRPPLHSATGLATNSRPFKTASVDSGGSLIDRESHESAAEVLGLPEWFRAKRKSLNLADLSGRAFGCSLPWQLLSWCCN